MATTTDEPAPATNGAAASPVPDDNAQVNSGAKRKREDSTPQVETVIKTSTPPALEGEQNAHLQESLKDILKVLRR